MKSQTPFILSLIAILILGSILFNNESENVTRFFSALPTTKEKPKSEEIDFKISNFETSAFNSNGELESKLHANELSSFENNSSTKMLDPSITFFSNDPEKNPWQLNSEIASSNSPHTKILFQNNVILKKTDLTPNDLPLEIHTNEISVDTEKKIAVSDQDVSIFSDKNQTDGTGLLANMEQNKLQLLKNIHSHYKSSSDKKGAVTNVQSESFYLDSASQKATYSGNVVFTRGNITIKADKLELIQAKSGERNAFAYGTPTKFIQHSVLDNKIINAQAERFEYSSNSQILKMYDQARLEQNNAIVEGDYLYYDTRTENIGAESKTSKRVKMVLPVN